MRKVSPILPREITDGFLIGAIIQSDPAVRVIQDELQEIYPDVAVRPDQIRAILSNSVLQETVLYGADMLVAKAQIADLKKSLPTRASSSEGKQRTTAYDKAVPAKITR